MKVTSSNPVRSSCGLKNDNYFEMLKEAEDVQLVSCRKTTGGNVTGEVNFDSCLGFLAEDFDDSTTRFKVPVNGFYAISFSAVLQSIQGSRIWIHLNMKDVENGQDCILGTAFSGLYVDGIQFEKEDILALTASTSLTSLERLKQGDEIWISIGKKELGSAMIIQENQPAVFNIKLVAADE